MLAIALGLTVGVAILDRLLRPATVCRLPVRATACAATAPLKQLWQAL
jgi:hypothetical protein